MSIPNHEEIANLTIGSPFKIPEFTVNIKSRIGTISHLLLEECQAIIESIEITRISPRVTEKVFTFSNGQKLIITTRSKIPVIPGIDGALTIDKNGEIVWLHHTTYNTLLADIQSIKLPKIAENIEKTWAGCFRFTREIRNSSGNITVAGLRPPQIGALYSIGAHWSLSNKPATIVMPTGTGKTEVMIATSINYDAGKVLIIVPSKALRNQTYRKFVTLGLLAKLKVVPSDIRRPLVGIITKRPQNAEDLSIFDNSNVIISTMQVLSSISKEILKEISGKVKTLLIDEAHHIAAPGWSAFKELFSQNKIIQFTATPFRRDGKLVDGIVIFQYPLATAQQDGYFKKINFTPVQVIGSENADLAISEKAIEQLKNDLNSGFDHIIMARCADIERAQEVFKIYTEKASEFNPVILHSELPDSATSLRKLLQGSSRIVVCVNMLGEGFDLPRLKIAALHDIHKSLAIILQFTGRFTRTNSDNIGDATIIANTANPDVLPSLERLYSEDADWNILLSELSSESAKSHSRLIKFLNESKQLDSTLQINKTIEISSHLLAPTFNTLVYKCEKFEPKKFHEGLDESISVQQVWIHEESNTLYFISRINFPLRWTRAKNIQDNEWHLNVLHFDQTRNLLFFSTTDKNSDYSKMVTAVGSLNPLSGELIFRCLGRISRLLFQNIGVKKHGRRNLRFAMYVGADVVQALTLTEKGGSSKSNLSGTGWENGHPISIGCSYKGRIWAKQTGSIPELISWCEAMGDKLLDNSIDPSKIIENVLIPEEITELPDVLLLGVEWPIEILRKSEERIIIYDTAKEYPISLIDIISPTPQSKKDEIDFQLMLNSDAPWANYCLKLTESDGFSIIQKGGENLRIKIGKLDEPLQDYLTNYPPLFRYLDLSELDGNLLIKPQNQLELVIPENCFEAWDWGSTDIKKESMWKNNELRMDSIQWFVAQHYINGNYEIVFDDDSAGEAADLVCLLEDVDHIKLTLIHCKFTKSNTPGERINDVVEVCAQAIRSAKWKWKFKDLCHHILSREQRLRSDVRTTRFLSGDISTLNRISQAGRFKEIQLQILIAQPGISKSNNTADQRKVIASAHSFLKETIGIDLEILCSI